MDSFYKKITTSRFYSWGDKLGDIMIMSLLWVLFCLPVVTFIPSCSALYYTCLKHKKSGLPVSKLFMNSFKSNLKQGVLINIIYLLYSFIAGTSIFFGYYGIGNVKLPDNYFPFSFVTLLPIILTMPFVVTLMARFDNSIKSTLVNGFTLSVMNIGTTLIIWIVSLLSIALMIVFPPSLLVVPGIVIIYINSLCEKVFASATKMEEYRAQVNSDSSDDNNDEDKDAYDDDNNIENNEDVSNEEEL